MTPQEVAEAFFAPLAAMIVGHHAHTTRDGTIYHFYRGKIKDKNGPDSAPRALVVVEPNGTVHGAQALRTTDRKKLRFFLKKNH